MDIKNRIVKSSFLSIAIMSLLINVGKAETTKYRLGVGDRVLVTVFNETDLSVETRINDSGAVNMPYIGSVQAIGLTPQELEHEIELKLGADYLVNPEVSVDIREFRPFFIQGAVRNPGSYPYQLGLTIERATAIAGGFTSRADKSIFNLAREEAGDATELRVPLRARLEPGDIVTVKESFF